MSNIFDALNKQKGTPGQVRPDPIIPISPETEDSAALPAAGEPERDLEMERLRQRILLELGPLTSATLVFSGAVEGEGATTMALLFARELARAEKKPVLLIDADLAGYPQSLSGALRHENAPRPGLTDLLEERATLASTLLATEQPYLHFLPRGTEAGAPLDVIKPERVKRFFRELEQHYSFVVIDCSPLLLAPETGLLAGVTDGVVVVVRANRTRREIVQRALKVLQNGSCRVLGAVLNERRYPIPAFLYRRL